MLGNKLYDVLKTLALVVFPALGTMYYALAAIWGLPAAEQVVATIVSIDTFLGVIIKLGDASYNASEGRYDGSLIVASNEKGTGGVVNLDLKKDPDTLASDQDEVTLKVKAIKPA